MTDDDLWERELARYQHEREIQNRYRRNRYATAAQHNEGGA